jgi:RNA-binding protein
VTTLNSRQRTFLKALGHHLSPVVHLGHQGVTAELAEETGRALDAHELIKVKLAEHAPGERRELADKLAQETQAVVAQVIGRVVLLYRAREKDPEIQLPK